MSVFRSCSFCDRSTFDIDDDYMVGNDHLDCVVKSQDIDQMLTDAGMGVP